MRLSRVRGISPLLILLVLLMMVLPIRASPEYAVVEVRIRTINLNEEPIANVVIEAYNATGDTEAFVMKEETNQTGWATLNLVNDTYYSFKAFWKDVQVGSLPKRHITSNVTIGNLKCSLAHIKTMVIDEADVPLPLINITLTYDYLTRYNETFSEKISFETGGNGTMIAFNVFTNVSYTIDARRYGFLFNRTSIPNLNQLLEGGWANITITCPTYRLFIHVLDSGRLPLPGAQVDIYEWSGQILVQSGTTNDRGSIAINCTFGKYKIKVYSYVPELESRVVLNETVVDLIEDPLFHVIHCKIFNVTPSVAVIDYLGQPIPNAMIEIERKIEEEWAKIEPMQKTDSHGAAPLPKIGGTYRISVYVAGELCETRTLYLDETRVITFKIDKYTIISGYLLETSQLIAYVSISLLVGMLGLALAYRRLLQRVTRKRTA